MDFGIIGNCQYNALINRTGNVDWLCWPRFDSSFSFGALLDAEKGGSFQIGAPDGQAGHQEYETNTNILRTLFTTSDGAFEVIDFAPRFYQYDRYYKPTMLIRMVRPVRGQPLAKVSCRPTADYGRKACEVQFGSNHLRFTGAHKQIRLTTNASLNLVYEAMPFVVDKTYYFALTYGSPLESNLEHTCEEFYKRTREYWLNWVKHSYLPYAYQKEVLRSALVLKLHQFEDTGAIIASATTSIPEARGTVRNWDYRYCWPRDALFSLQALHRLTHFEEMEKFTAYLRNIVARHPDSEDRLQPVYGISGERDLKESILDHLAGYQGHQPVRIGNQAYEHLQHDVYGEMILAISQLYLDLRFVDFQSVDQSPMIADLLAYIERYLEAPDAGLWEFRGREQLHTFTLLMHWAGARMAERICERAGYEQLIDKARELGQRSQELIETKCWNKDLQAYTQAAGTSDMDASLLMLVNLGYLDADSTKARTHVDAVMKELQAEGGLLHRYKIKDDFGETHNTFTICSFWLVEALARIGRREEAAELFDHLLSRANHLGLYSEDIDPKTGELWGNFPQTYSHVGLINAAFALSAHDRSGMGSF